jgi:hypothetical protein
MMVANLAHNASAGGFEDGLGQILTVPSKLPETMRVKSGLTATLTT